MNKSGYYKYLASREWALLREKVRDRCHNICERCNMADMDQVHHLTYERTGSERLEDLQGVCKPCHEFLSAKSDKDPAVIQPWIYCAGKISKYNWRHKLVERLREVNALEMRGYGLKSKCKRFMYAGPYFVSCDHGCYHGPHSHGCAADVKGQMANACSDEVPDERRHDVITHCLHGINGSEVVFAWLDCNTCYGTLCEIGFAYHADKPIVVAGPRKLRDLWFAWEMGCAQYICATPEEGINTLLADKSLLYLLQVNRRITGHHLS